MYEYLRRHPQIFMPEHKEPHYFGADLTSLHEPLSETDYLGLFAGARPGQRVGEASTWYLYSTRAAEEIASFAPRAQFVAMLRNPVEVMYSLHRETHFYGVEPIEDFAEALAAEPERRAGRRPGPTRWREVLHYRDAVAFTDQLTRYLERFGAERVKIVLYDDLLADTPTVYADLLRFLGVDDTFRPAFARVNASKRPRYRLLQSLVVSPPGPIARAIPYLRRFPLAHRVRARILASNARQEARPPMDPDLRRRLREELQPEVERLGALIGRDLRHWTEVAPHADDVPAPLAAD